MTFSAACLRHSCNDAWLSHQVTSQEVVVQLCAAVQITHSLHDGHFFLHAPSSFPRSRCLLSRNTVGIVPKPVQLVLFLWHSHLLPGLSTGAFNVTHAACSRGYLCTRRLKPAIAGMRCVARVQVYKVSEALVKRFIWLVPGMLVGGENRHHEKQRLRKGVCVLTATPGRLLDHLRQTESFLVSHLQWLILDEADRLLDMGFQQALSSILELLDQRSAMSDTSRCSVSAFMPASSPTAELLRTVSGKVCNCLHWLSYAWSGRIPKFRPTLRSSHSMQTEARTVIP